MEKRIDGRSTVYNEITSPEKLAQVNPDNIQLENDFLEYLESVDRAKTTIKQYKANLHIFWCWNLEYNKNKFFVELTKRELVKFQNHTINEWGWSPRRVRVVKATLSSMSNYIENILDDEFENYRPIINKIESPVNEAVREKSVLTMEELQPLLDTLVEYKEFQKACVLALGMYSGRRKAELVRFKVSFFEDANLICNGALYKTPEKIKTKGRGSKGKLINVYVLANPFKPYFNYWMKQRNELGIKSDWLFPKFKDGEWVDEPMDTGTIDSYFRTFSRITGKPKYPHALRHLFCSYLLDQNLPESVVQDIICWSTADMVHLYDDRPKDAQLEKYFGAEGIKQVEQKGLSDL